MGSVVTNGVFDEVTVSAMQLVGAFDFLVSPAGEAFVNIKRIIGEFHIGLSNSFINGAAANFRGAVFWAIFIQDLSDNATLSPDSSVSLTEEAVLAHGVVPVNGSLNALTGAGWNTYIPPVRFDVKSNRRCTELQECYIAFTGQTGSLNLDGEDTFNFTGAVRTLITTNPKTV